MPSHHGPDVRTVLHNVEIFTTALSVPSTLMHLHAVTVDVEKKVNVDEVIELFKKSTRIRVVRNAEQLRSTAEIMEFARECNKYFNDKAPWSTRKTDMEATKVTLAYSLRAIYFLGCILRPFIDKKAANILEIFGTGDAGSWESALDLPKAGTPIKKIDVLFTKMELED